MCIGKSQGNDCYGRAVPAGGRTKLCQNPVIPRRRQKENRTRLLDVKKRQERCGEFALQGGFPMVFLSRGTTQ